MLETAIKALERILQNHSWVTELAGILPLSALIDFIDIPAKLHIFQLVGAAPLWSWPITPAGSRLLLSDDRDLQRHCYLDRYGNSVPLVALDGRFGAEYVVASPETIRLCIASLPAHAIINMHPNMKGRDLRLQELDIIHVMRSGTESSRTTRYPWLRNLFLDPWRLYSFRYLATSLVGWATLLAAIAMSAVLQTYIALAFLVAIPFTGVVVYVLYGSTPRGLLVSTGASGTKHDRLVLVAEHLNATHWTALYGDSILLNSLLNRPLEPRGPSVSTPTTRTLFRTVLRILILSQWAMILAAAATKDWNSYFICFWITFCIAVHAYVIPVRSSAADWVVGYAGVRLKRYQTSLSSRRAILNTILALNPATPALGSETQQPSPIGPDEGPFKWIDPILEQGPARARWQEASRMLMEEAQSRGGKDAAYPSSRWADEYSRDYWSPYVLEGIEVAAQIKQEANLLDEPLRVA